MSAPLSILRAVRINAIMQGLLDVREIPEALIWTQRIPDQPADDDEIMARFTGQVLMADLVADDHEAVTYNSGKFSFESNDVPNIKIGVNVTQKQLNQLYGLKQIAGGVRDDAGALDWETRTLMGIEQGIEQRAEALRIAMLCDGLSYDRLGIKMTNVTWGMPADLKITPTIPWDNVNATPVTDITMATRTAQVRYGLKINRASMSLSAFLYMIATNEFQAKAKLFIPTGVAFNQLNVNNNTEMQTLALKVLGLVDIEFTDLRAWTESKAGAITSEALQPITKVILSATGNDGDMMCWDFADGIVTESIVNALVPGAIIGQFNGAVRGPASYASAEHNPPRVTYWGVKRGFPRKHLLQSNAVLSVGTFTDVIPVGAPF